MVSNGPYVLSEVVVGDRITLTKNPMYWDAKDVGVTRVNCYPLDTNLQVSRFIAGDVQFASYFPGVQYRWLKSQLGDQVVTGPYLGVQMLAFNMVDPPFANNRNLRLALSMALDRNILVKLSQGMNPAAYSIVPSLPGYIPQPPDWASWSDD